MAASSHTAAADVAAVRPSWTYRIVFATAALTTAIVIVFFFIGLADGSVGSFNIGLWVVILGGLGAVLFVGHYLARQGWRKAAIALLSVVAVPALLYGLILVLTVSSGTSWH